MTAKLSHEEFVAKLMLSEDIKKEYLVESEYITNHVKVIMRHKTCGTVFEAAPSKLLAKRHPTRCPACAKKRVADSNRTSSSNFMANLLARRPEFMNRYLVQTGFEEYSKKLGLKCRLCGKDFHVLPTNLLKGQDCPCTKMEKISRSLTKSHDEFLADVAVSYLGSEYVFNEKYRNSDTKISVTHLTCGYTYKVTPNKFLQERRCPRCSGKGKSKAVKKILDHLDSLEIYYETEFVHESIKNEETSCCLPFDLAFLTKELELVLFEFDGIQHFRTTKSNQWVVDEDQLRYRMHLDAIKTKRCKELGIRLIRLNHSHESNFASILPRMLNRKEFLLRNEFDSLS